MVILSLSVKPNLIFVILILVFVAPQISSARGNIIFISMEPTILGGAINGVNWAPYRINYETWDAYPVLHPEPINGKILITLSDHPSNMDVSIIVELNLTITETRDDTLTTVIRLHFILLNNTLTEGNNAFNLDEIDHLGGVSVVQDDGSVVPKSSYLYAEELKPGTNITSTISIFFEQSDHTIDWDVQFGIEGQLEYNGDVEFYVFLLTEPLNTSTSSGISFYFNVLLLMPLAIIVGRVYSSKRNFL